MDSGVSMDLSDLGTTGTTGAMKCAPRLNNLAFGKAPVLGPLKSGNSGYGDC